MAAEAKQFRVYAVIPRPKQDDFWLNCGMLFPNKDGKGFNILLQALPAPLDGQWKLVAREYDPAKAKKTDDGTNPD